MVSGPPQEVAPPAHGIGDWEEIAIKFWPASVDCPTCTLPKSCGLGTLIRLRLASVLVTASPDSAMTGRPEIAGLVAMVRVAVRKPCVPPLGWNFTPRKQDPPAAIVNGRPLNEQLPVVGEKSAALVPASGSDVTWTAVLVEGFEMLILAW